MFECGKMLFTRFVVIFILLVLRILLLAALRVYILLSADVFLAPDP